jgi:hypothetical protein
VITSWQHKGFDPSPGEGRLQVWSFNSGTSYTLVGRSGIEPFTAGATPTYLTRIPVSGGERLAVRTPTLTDGCTFQTALSGDVVNYNALPADPADPAPGDTHDLVNQSGNTRLNVVAAVEPDADHDGFGDESQDQCLGAAGDQSGCPPAAAAAAPTGQRARAIRKCKKKLPPGDRRKRCLKKARKLPV